MIDPSFSRSLCAVLYLLGERGERLLPCSDQAADLVRALMDGDQKKRAAALGAALVPIGEALGRLEVG
jgi:hypothetical protein